MISGLIIFVVLVALSFSLWHLFKNSGRGAHNHYFNRKENEIDVEVLKLLLSRDEDEYLRRSLPGNQFRQLKRNRIRVAWAYLEQINQSTRHLIHVVESARSSTDPEVSRAAHEMLQIAFRVRMNVPIVQVTLLVEWLWPMLHWPRHLKIDSYRDLVERVVFILQRLEASQSGTVPQLGNSL